MPPRFMLLDFLCTWLVWRPFDSGRYHLITNILVYRKLLRNVILIFAGLTRSLCISNPRLLGWKRTDLLRAYGCTLTCR